jgi:uncharacterized membrane protein YkoI
MRIRPWADISQDTVGEHFMFHELCRRYQASRFDVRRARKRRYVPGAAGSKTITVAAEIFIELCVWLVLAVVSTSVSARELGVTPLESAQGFGQSQNASTIDGTRAVAGARVSVQRAIAIAESRAVGAKIVDIGFDDQSDRVAYKVKTYQNNEIWTGTIDAWTGEIIGGGIVTPVARLAEREKNELASFKVAAMDLSQAIAIAEKYGGGSVLSAGLEEQHGKPIFVVVVVADGALKEVSVEMVGSCRDNNRAARKGPRRSSIVDKDCKATSPSGVE